MLVNRIRIGFIVVVSVMAISNAYSQLLIGIHRKQNTVYFTSGFYARAPLLSAGFAKCLHFKVGKIYDEHVTLFADFTSKSNFDNNNNLKFSYGGQGYIRINRDFKILVRKTFTFIRILTDDNKGSYLGGELEIFPGIYREKYFYAMHFYYGDSFKGHVVGRHQHTIAYNIATGWVKPRMGTFMTGFNGGYFIRKDLCIYFDIDFYVLRPKNPISVFPLLSEYLGINYIF